MWCVPLPACIGLHSHAYRIHCHGIVVQVLRICVRNSSVWTHPVHKDRVHVYAWCRVYGVCACARRAKRKPIELLFIKQIAHVFSHSLTFYARFPFVLWTRIFSHMNRSTFLANTWCVTIHCTPLLWSAVDTILNCGGGGRRRRTNENVLTLIPFAGDGFVWALNGECVCAFFLSFHFSVFRMLMLIVHPFLVFSFVVVVVFFFAFFSLRMFIFSCSFFDAFRFTDPCSFMLARTCIFRL